MACIGRASAPGRPLQATHYAVEMKGAYVSGTDTSWEQRRDWQGTTLLELAW